MGKAVRNRGISCRMAVGGNRIKDKFPRRSHADPRPVYRERHHLAGARHSRPLSPRALYHRGRHRIAAWCSRGRWIYLRQWLPPSTRLSAPLSTPCSASPGVLYAAAGYPPCRLRGAVLRQARGYRVRLTDFAPSEHKYPPLTIFAEIQHPTPRIDSTVYSAN